MPFSHCSASPGGRVVTASSVRLYSSPCTYKLYLPLAHIATDAIESLNTPHLIGKLPPDGNDRAMKERAMIIVFEEGEIDVWRAAINKAM